MSIMSYNGGTVVAMAGEECICIGSDLRLGEQRETIATDVKKLHKVGDRIYVGLAGFHSDAKTLLDKILFQKGLYELRENRKLSPEVVTTMISNLLYKHRFGPFYMSPVVAGLHPVTNKPLIAEMDLIGCVTTPRDFVATGAGAEFALGVCEAFWRENMGADELFEATAQALLSALERDASSGWGAVVYTITKDKVNVKTLRGRMD